MATSLLILIDDITSVLDDVATMSKIAAKQTVGVLGDDLALNAEQISTASMSADRELPIVWAVTKGSFLNKLILVPLALIISAISPKIIIFLLMIGGAYLCFEGFEKIAHSYLFHQKEHNPSTDMNSHSVIKEYSLGNPRSLEDRHKLEQQKIKGAIRTDFVLSAEIIVISLGALSNNTMIVQIISLSLLALFFTIFVYGLVAGIVKIDDLGLWLTKQPNHFKQGIGQSLLLFAPILMKLLSIVGTAAMFLVGGGIIAHGVPFIHYFNEFLMRFITTAPVHKLISTLINLLLNGFVGLVVGGGCFAGFLFYTKIRRVLKP